MKIKDNRKLSATREEMYQVGNVICDASANPYMVVSSNNCRYALLDLGASEVITSYRESLSALCESCCSCLDTLADVSLIVAGKE